MDISINSNTQFKGYDAIRLRGLYMQGIIQKAERGIFDEMAAIAKKENLDLFINQNNSTISRTFEDDLPPARMFLSYWGQDRKSFVRRGDKNTILWNRREDIPQELNELGEYEKYVSGVMPRGGNYYIGFKPDGERWIIVNGKTIYGYGGSLHHQEVVAPKGLETLTGIKPENMYFLKQFQRDLDEFIRPVGYPYVLVNDCGETLKNITKLAIKFPQSTKINFKLNNFSKTYAEPQVCKDIAKQLEQKGFIPIKIGARYSEDINFINALAFKNEENGISYITNSTKYSCPELEYLEELFKADLEEKVPQINHIYFVSGGEKTKQTFGEYDWISTHNYPQQRFNEYHNVIMDFLGEHHGGIHCMTAEIPDFNRLNYHA